MSTVALEIIKSSSVGSPDGLQGFALFSCCVYFRAWLWCLACTQANNEDFWGFSVWSWFVFLLLSASFLLFYCILQNSCTPKNSAIVYEDCFPVTEFLCPPINWKLVQLKTAGPLTQGILSAVNIDGCIFLLKYTCRRTLF